MKVMTRILTVVLALTLVFSLAVTAFAEDVTTGSITNTTERSYKAYQIFSGTQAENGVALGDVNWGTGINHTGDAFLNALKADTTFVVGEANIFADCTTAKDVAEVLAGYTDKSPVAQAFAKLAYSHLTETAIEIEASKTVNIASGYYLMVDQTVVDELHKSKNPALLQVTNDSQLNITEKAGVPTVDKTIKNEAEVAEGSIGDTFTFVLTATMPDTFEGYDSYKVVFHDTLSKGLTIDKNSIKVSVEGFTSVVNEGEDETTITITNNNVLLNGVTAGSKITIEYNATLNKQAEIGSAGNPNVIYLEFSNDPNWEGDPGDEDEPTGKTPIDTVVVFTYELDVTKVDGANTSLKLAGAEFKLQNADNKWAVVDGNGRMTGWTENKDDATPLISDTNGLIKIIGLDQGTYNLEEIKAPAGYNKLSTPVVLVVTSNVTDAEDEQALKELTLKVGDESGTGDIESGIVGATVKNNAGAELPETGGIGTTLFYIIGGVLALAAVVLLVTKKRMSSES